MSSHEAIPSQTTDHNIANSFTISICRSHGRHGASRHVLREGHGFWKGVWGFHRQLFGGQRKSQVVISVFLSVRAQRGNSCGLVW